MRPALMTLALLGWRQTLHWFRRTISPENRQRWWVQPGPKRAYLGLEIEPVPAAVFSQLSGTRWDRVFSLRICPRIAPASQAGLRRYDILLSYDNQRLHAPEQLIELVVAKAPGESEDAFSASGEGGNARGHTG